MELPDKKEHLWSSWGDNGPHRETNKRWNNASESRTWKRYRNWVSHLRPSTHFFLFFKIWLMTLGHFASSWWFPSALVLQNDPPGSASNCLNPFLCNKPSKIDSEKFQIYIYISVNLRELKEKRRWRVNLGGDKGLNGWRRDWGSVERDQGQKVCHDL